MDARILQDTFLAVIRITIYTAVSACVICAHFDAFHTAAFFPLIFVLICPYSVSGYPLCQFLINAAAARNAAGG